jgi:hypothetical protein
MTRAAVPLVVLLLIAAAGCSPSAFRLKSDTCIKSNMMHLDSGSSTVAVMAQSRLATELTRRTGRPVTVSNSLFGDEPEPTSDAPKNSIYLLYITGDDRWPAGAYQVDVTPDYILIRSSSLEGFDAASRALLATMQHEGGEYAFPPGTLLPPK